MNEIATLAALASRAMTRIKVKGQRGLTDLSEDEAFAMAFICGLLLNEYPGPLTKGAPLALNNKGCGNE